MAKLKQIISAILNDISQARAIADNYSRELKHSYKEDPFLKLLSVPRTDIKEVTIDLKFAILRDQNSASSTSKVTVYQDREYQGLSQELGEGDYEDIKNLEIYKQANSNLYEVENQWGGTSAPWHEGGQWVIGGRSSQNVVAIAIKSGDGGETLSGTMTYAGEGPIGFRATKSDGNHYIVENQWGGTSAPWHVGGMWVIGGRSDQNVIALGFNSTDGGKHLNGKMQYQREGPIGFKATAVEKNEQLSSVKVPEGMKITLYEAPGLQGKAKTFTQDTPWVGDDFNGVISSIKVERLVGEDIEDINVEVVTNELTNIAESSLSSISLTLDLTSV